MDKRNLDREVGDEKSEPVVQSMSCSQRSDKDLEGGRGGEGGRSFICWKMPSWGELESPRMHG